MPRMCRMLLWACLVFGAAPASAQPQGLSVTPRPETVAIIDRMPQAIGPWRRVPLATQGDGITGLMARYQVPGLEGQTWASVFVGLVGPGWVPNGPDTPELDGLRAANTMLRGQGTVAVVARRVAAPGAPTQLCSLASPAVGTAGSIENGCVTGAGGHYVRVRITHRVPPEWGAHQSTILQMSDMLVANATQVAAQRAK